MSVGMRFGKAQILVPKRNSTREGGRRLAPAAQEGGRRLAPAAQRGLLQPTIEFGGVERIDGWGRHGRRRRELTQSGFQLDI
jgi:hypothetical protein